ncbi:MAG TPA: PilZ domain-containing protein [Phycisphaerales bacterium]|nr:PilZ domain-containing protein [Phycisphaerales bacterium]
MPVQLNRRQFARYRVEPMYTRVLLRPEGAEDFDIEGHAYDISEGGVRFEADRTLLPGTKVAMRLELSPAAPEADGARELIEVLATIVWVEDEDDPPPVRTAAVITGFAGAVDRERLRSACAAGRLRLAA